MEHEDVDPESSGVAEAFAQGDDIAVESFFRENANVLLTMARRIAPSTLDPEDLLSEAVASVFNQWSKGVGPKTYIKAYIVQSMRNRVKDELRSPRSRTYNLELAEEAPAEPSPHLQRVELSNEIRLVRQALRILPEAQQAILRETIVNGRKPGELEEAFSRPSTSITALAARAKANLRRAMLQTLIAEGTDACRKAVRHVPNPVSPEIALVDKHGRPTHFAGCAHCRRSWARFSALPSALGMAVLLVLSEASFGAAPAASASEQLSEDPALRPRNRLRNATLLGVAFLALAAAAVATTFPLDVQSAGPKADVEVVREPLAASRVMYSIRLSIQAAAWHPQQATFTGPHAIAAIEPPEGWTCTVTDSRADCEALAEDSGLEGFVVEYSGEVALPAFELQVIAVTSDGATVTTNASGAGLD